MSIVRGRLCVIVYGTVLHFMCDSFRSVTASTVFLLLADIEDVLPERSNGRSKSFSVIARVGIKKTLPKMPQN